MFWVYVIKNEKRKTYIGQTSDLENRIKHHNGSLTNKKTSYTFKNKGIWQLVYNEEFKTRIEALKREKELKSYQGRRFIKSILG